MNKKTLKALKGSIEKWRKIAFEGGEDWAEGNCELCKKHPDCIGCPVAAHTQKDFCDGSPYEDWSDHQRGHGTPIPQSVFDDKSKELAKQEYEFLKSLLPEGEAA